MINHVPIYHTHQDPDSRLLTKFLINYMATNPTTLNFNLVVTILVTLQMWLPNVYKCLWNAGINVNSTFIVKGQQHAVVTILHHMTSCNLLGLR